MRIKNVRVFQEDGSFRPGDICMENGLFAKNSKEEGTVDGENLYAVPGFVDIHFHGCAGHDFSDGTRKALDAITEYELKNGITTLVPAAMSYPKKEIEKIVRNAFDYQQAGDSMIAGVNLEGPFLSYEKRGAQNPEYLQLPDSGFVQKLQEAYPDFIRLIGLAPELEGAMDFIEKLGKKIKISIAHSAADYRTAGEAFARGAAQVTHLYNGMTSFSHREPGILGAAFEAKHCMVELICDGVHIHDTAVRMTLQLFGSDRVIFISDSMRATGMPDGSYCLGGQEVHVCGSQARLADGGLAGSVTNLMGCVRNAVKQMGIPLGTAIKCATVNPAKAAGIYEFCGSLDVGKRANLLLLDENLEIQKLYFEGNSVE